MLAGGLLSLNVVNSATLPNVKNFFNVLRKNVANNGCTDISLLHQSIYHWLDELVSFLNATIEESKQICDRFFPVRCLWILWFLLLKVFWVSQIREVVFIDWFDDGSDKGVFLNFKVPLFDMFEKIWATCLSYKKSSGSSTALQRDFSSIL